MGRYHTTTEDIAAVSLPVLRHRVILTFNAEAAGKSPDDVVRHLMQGKSAGARLVPSPSGRG
jgi:MoxR-like ATPase